MQITAGVNVDLQNRKNDENFKILIDLKIEMWAHTGGQQISRTSKIIKKLTRFVKTEKNWKSKISKIGLKSDAPGLPDP